MSDEEIYEQIIDDVTERMERVKAPLSAFYNAMRDLRSRANDWISMGIEMGETDRL
jgi:hypothetical protein